MHVMYYASMLWCWQLVMILIKTNHHFLRVGCQRLRSRTTLRTDNGRKINLKSRDS
jgi:hypothetical protein